MSVYTAAATRSFNVSEKHCTTTATNDNYYIAILTTLTSHGAWHMDCICAENVMQVLWPMADTTRMIRLFFFSLSLINSQHIVKQAW